ncbi:MULTISPECIES: DUF2157 domain-containing protein [unclassified Bradyrhizobium]|uniref:DUF2157 domain-containing protein n=1 Tax=unclassified Bradyrhizobium TaxID=2631580 RepID=UPI002916450D|nr:MULTISPECIES: DUF2157 domain-containing protein [unclassified Bradyrhizobium]
MFERTYRQRLETDLARWEADGLITPSAAIAIRNALPPLSPAANISVVVGIVGGLLIAAAFLAFVAAHWTDIARLLRCAILAAGIIVVYGLGAWFARADRSILADLCASVGAIIFGAGIALVGQMYHLGSDFAGGMLLWAIGALAAAALTGSRGALATALVAACIWSDMRLSEGDEVPHLAFVAFWLVAAGLAVLWQSRVAAHLVALAAVNGWIATASRLDLADPLAVFADGTALLLGAGLALAALRPPRLSGFGIVLSAYGGFMLAVVAVLGGVAFDSLLHPRSGAGHPAWAHICGIGGMLLAFAAAAITRRPGSALAGLASGLALLALEPGIVGQGGQPWLVYAIELGAMICLVISGMTDTALPRIVAGWLGIAGVIAAITWIVSESLLSRSLFLAVAGLAAVALSILLNRLLPRDAR